MSDLGKAEAGIARYELAVEIQASPDVVWAAIVQETNAWWLPDFHIVGPGSTVTLDARAGGGLVEAKPDGGSLLWCTVHWIDPGTRTLSLVGHLAPDWGGPVTSFLKLVVKEIDAGSVLEVTDTHHGNIDARNMKSLEEGWTSLFTDGLKAFAERGVRQDG